MNTHGGRGAPEAQQHATVHFRTSLCPATDRRDGGPSRNRTGVQGFAVLCVTTPPSGRADPGKWSGGHRLSTDCSAHRSQWSLVFSTGGGACGLALRPSGDMHSLARLVYYWHTTAMVLEELMTQPMPDFAAARRAMIDSQLRPQGVTDPAVLSAMAAVPREEFVPDSVRPLAYGDRPIDLGDGQALMPPAA